MERIVLDSPIDAHLHLRDGPVVRDLVKYSAMSFAAAIVMPNLAEPVNSLDRLVAYAERVHAAAAFQADRFVPYFTLYFNPEWPPGLLGKAAGNSFLKAVKFYPKGVTHNSEAGCDPDDPGVPRLLAEMQEAGLVLCVHAETAGFCLRREDQFVWKYVARWAKGFPGLKIVVEHLSSRSSLPVLGEHENVYATLTPHHLTGDLDEVLGGNLNPHAFCKPVLKYPEDREELAAAAAGWKGPALQQKLMLGTDSAPHTRAMKEECGCAGVFNATVALRVIAPLFTDRAVMQAFVADNAARLYGIKAPRKRVFLTKGMSRVFPSYQTAAGDIVPWRAGAELAYMQETVAVGEAEIS